MWKKSVTQIFISVHQRKKHIHRIFASRLRQITDIMTNWRGRIVEKAWQLKEESGHFAPIKSNVTTCLSVY
jgi:hypothetical protein